MPIYAYKCSKCQHDLEKLQSFNDEMLTVCPECKEPTLEKQLSANTSFCLFGKDWTKPGNNISNKNY